MVARYHLEVVDQGGIVVAPLPKAAITAVSEELNAPGSTDFTLPPTMDGGGADALVYREVQAYRNDQLLKWSVIVRPRLTRQGWSIQAPGLWWWIKQRLVGRAGRTNWLVNGSFETGDLTGWAPVGVTSAVVTSHHTVGSYAVQLTQDTPLVDTWLNQQVTAIPGNYYTLDADLHIYADYPYHGPAFEQRGLHVELVYPGGVVQGVSDASIDDSYSPGRTYHLETGITVPADAPTGAFLQIRLYAPGGRVMWDDVELTLMESLSFQMVDTVNIVQGLLAHAQDAAYGKDDLAIGLGAHPGTLGVRSEAFQFVDHQNIGSIIEGYSSAQFGPDFAIVHPDPRTRQLALYAPKGADRPDLPFSYTGKTGDTCYGDPEYDGDGEAGRSSVITQGDGSGPGRPEAAYVDTSVTGGHVLEEVQQAAPGTSKNDLPLLSQERVGRSKAALKTVVLTVRPGVGYVGVLATGDRVPVNVRYAGLILNETMRVVRWEAHPDDSMRVTLNGMP